MGHPAGDVLPPGSRFVPRRTPGQRGSHAPTPSQQFAEPKSGAKVEVVGTLLADATSVAQDAKRQSEGQDRCSQKCSK